MSVRSLVRSGLVNFAETRSMLVGNEAFSLTDFYLISTSTISENTANVIFDTSSLSSRYKHLQIRVAGRTTKVDTDEQLRIRFNSDTGTNYSSHAMFGTSDVFSTSSISQTYIDIARLAAANLNSNIYGPGVIDILDPFSASKNKTLRSFSSADRPTTPMIDLSSGAWYSTAPVTSIALFTTTSFVAGSRFSLYGIKG
jgi:hypothetical protein